MLRLLFLSCLLITGLVSAEAFQAPVTNTKWHLVESPLSCSLTQDIPGYGEAGFHRNTGAPLILTFSTYNQPSTQNNVAFVIAEAPWQNSDDHLPLTSVPTEMGQKKFSIEGLTAEQALTHLEEGQFPVIHYRSLTGMKDITVKLSTVHLLDSLYNFQQCLANLHPDTFTQVQFLTVYFDLEKSDLTSLGKKALDRLAAYVKVDDSIQEIHITGHTDNHGRKSLNEPLAQARTEVIRDYLVKQHEIDPAIIMLTSYVERKPAATNRTQLGRAYNRRAEITLIR